MHPTTTRCCMQAQPPSQPPMLGPAFTHIVKHGSGVQAEALCNLLDALASEGVL